MTGVDWIIVGVVVLLALFGAAQGFLAGALSLAGFALGAWLGTLVAPLVLSDGSDSPYAPLFGLLGALFVGAIFATGFEGVGSALGRFVRRVPGLGPLDGLLGAVLMGVVGLGISWVLGAVALQTPGAEDLRRDIQRSTILAELNDVLPSRDLLNALARFDPSPRINGPNIDLAPPDSAIARDPQVQAAGDSVVRILGTACGLGVEGSGWVAADDVVVTNAHVVAGQDDTRVHPGGGVDGLRATVVSFDSRNDLAVLRVPGLDEPALRIATRTRANTAGAILGFPLDGPYRVRSARLGETRNVLAQDAYGNGPVQRSIVSFRGVVQPGNSGGPVVNAKGRVIATVFASTTAGARGGYGVPNALVRDALADTTGQVSTGDCAR